MNLPRLLVVELHHLGDAVLSLPFIDAASHSREIHVLCRPICRRVFEWMVDPARVHDWNPPWHEDSPPRIRQADGYRAVLRKLRETAPDACACVWADPRVHLLTKLAGIPMRAGFPVESVNFLAADFPPRRRRFLAGVLLNRATGLLPATRLLTHPCRKRSPMQHQSESWNQLLAAIAGDAQSAIMPPPSVLPAAASEAPRANAVLGVAPHARLASKCWPARHFREASVEAARARGMDILWILPPDADVPPPVADDVSVAIRRPGSLDALRETIASCSLVLGNDSLIPHLAHACGVPAIAVFRTGCPEWFAPGGAPGNALHAPASRTIPYADGDGNPSYVAEPGPAVSTVVAALAAAG